ncbi:MAG: CRISPR-associated helicase Cas3', partial [Chloroflexota bacterium]
MPKVDQATYEDRKMRVFLTLRRYPNGLTEADLEQETGFTRRTLNNYLRALETEGKIYKDGLTWVALPFDELRLRHFELSPEEAMTLYLATRLLAKQHDKRNEPAETALMKLAAALKTNEIAGKEIHQAAQELAQRPAQEEYDLVFRAVMQAYIYRRVLRITYEPLNRQAFETDFSPYLIEPSAIGFTTYAIGHSSIVNATRTYKLERIKAATLTRQQYDIPREFRGLDVLKSAWSVIYGENLLTVVLRFSPNVRKRVEETRWHFSEEKRDDPAKPGYLLWQAQVADTTDMLPWLRGWGADVEVVEPRELRNALTREAQELAELYQVMEAKARQMVYYAHTKDGKDESEWQKLIDHLTRVGNYAAEFGRDAGISEMAKIAGLTHDLGKYSKEFQERLRGSKRKVDHATAGATELTHLFKGTPQEPLAALLAYCLSGHHTGLLDYGSSSDLPGDGTLQARLKTDVCDYSAYKTELDLATLEFPQQLHIHPSKGRMGFSLAFHTRMIYSALVDADFQETEEFIQGKKPRGEHESIQALRDRFNDHLRHFDNPETDINRKRTETLRACMDKTTEKPGFFTLTVPTGGGKTLASMAFALNHAVMHELKRIIYVIPFTTIIEQNAGVFKDILGEENVLEHHSNFDWEQKKREAIETTEDQTKSVYAKLKLAAENWDIPIVVTTNVQFFESLFANKSSRCRKLHNIAKSVIIFDEAQMFPKDYMLPAMGAVWELVTNYSASAVFCTATQPKLEKFLPEKTQITELAPDPQELFNFYKRVQVKQLDKLPDDDLIARLNEHEQVLCIVNTRRHASGLFQKLNRDGSYHLSTLMCPTHRKQKLAEIRTRLESGQPCRVVSTSVMEAGIDVDFPLGYRALTGLDSINQAAGRVNRNMRRALGEVFVFEPDSEFIKRTPRYIAQGVEVTRSVLGKYNSAPISIPAIEAYFERLYALKEPRDFDYKDILCHFDNQQPIYKFATVAEKFRVIEDVTHTVIIPFDEEAKRLIEELKFTQYPSSTLRKLQPYTVSIYEGEFDALSSQGVILTIADAYAVLNPGYFEQCYDPDTGILVPASG